MKTFRPTCIVFLFAALVVCFSTACNDKRSTGEQPVIVDDASGAKAPAAQDTQQVGEYEHVKPAEQYPGGVQPNDTKAQKLVNQLFNYVYAICRTTDCPKTLDEARAALKKEYKMNWPKDPWGNYYDYVYRSDDDFDVRSWGPDGKPDTDDDIKVSEINRTED